MTARDFERFFAKVEEDSDSACWRWTAYTSDGYGIFHLAGRNQKAHRVVYEMLVGPLPPHEAGGLELDHLCENRACVNPTHLELVTRRVNVLRGAAPSAENARKTHCAKGHPLSGYNAKPCKKGVQCRECHRAHLREWKRAERARDREMAPSR